jgi:hypothetical protein
MTHFKNFHETDAFTVIAKSKSPKPGDVMKRTYFRRMRKTVRQFNADLDARRSAFPAAKESRETLDRP